MQAMRHPRTARPRRTIGYGAMALVPGMYGDSDDEQALATLQHAVDAGATFIDTADAYGDGDNERLVGRALARPPRRASSSRPSGASSSRAAACRSATPTRRRSASTRARSGRARRSRPASQRLGVDHVDLWYLHFPDPGVPDRGDRRRDGRARRGGQGPPPRPLQRQRRAGPRRPPGAPARRRPVRVLALDPRPRARAAARRSPSWASASCPWSPLGAGFFAGTVKDTEHGLPRQPPALHPREPRRQPRPLRAAARDRRASSASRPPSSRSPGSCTSARTSSRSPAPAPRRTSTRTCAPPTSPSTRRRSRGSTSSRRRAARPLLAG